MLGASLRSNGNTYIASDESPGYQRYQELARIAGVSRAFTLSVKLGLYTLLRDVQDKTGTSDSRYSESIFMRSTLEGKNHGSDFTGQVLLHLLLLTCTLGKRAYACLTAHREIMHVL